MRAYKTSKMQVPYWQTEYSVHTFEYSMTPEYSLQLQCPCVLWASNGHGGWWWTRRASARSIQHWDNNLLLLYVSKLATCKPTILRDMQVCTNTSIKTAVPTSPAPKTMHTLTLLLGRPLSRLARLHSGYARGFGFKDERSSLQNF
jgi:hypothetical protein